jgi:hypothetical protein
MIEGFARHTKGNAHIVFVGYNRASASSILASFPRPTIAGAGATHEFVEYDILAKTAFPLTVPEFARLVSRPDCNGIFSFSNFRGTELSGLVRNICTMSVCFEWESARASANQRLGFYHYMWFTRRSKRKAALFHTISLTRVLRPLRVAAAPNSEELEI